MIEEPDLTNVLGTPGRVSVLGVLSPGERSNFSTVLVILPDLPFPDPKGVMQGKLIAVVYTLHTY